MTIMTCEQGHSFEWPGQTAPIVCPECKKALVFCPECEGRGFNPSADSRFSSGRCGGCGGTGRVWKTVPDAV